MPAARTPPKRQQVAVRFDLPDLEEVQRLAEQWRCTKSQMIRVLVAEAVEARRRTRLRVVREEPE